MSSIAAENQVILRNLQALPAGKVLLVDALPDYAINEFKQQRPDIEWHAYTPFIDTYDSLSPRVPTFTGAWLESAQINQLDAVVIYFPKTKLRFDYYLSMISKLLKAGAAIFVVGEKKGGVKSAEKAMRPYCLGSKKLDSARHCMLFVGGFNGKACNKSKDDWFQIVEIEVTVGHQIVPLKLTSLPGVFSATQLDEGTALLLQAISDLDGKGLDFGCGCGVISAALSKAFNTKMLALDVDAMAISSTEKTFEINNIDGEVIHSNGLQNVLDKNLNVDFIATNPPFHTGIKTDYSIVADFVKQSSKILKNSYQIWLVANAFLPYPELFKQHLKLAKSQTVIKNKRFNVYHIVKDR